MWERTFGANQIEKGIHLDLYTKTRTERNPSARTRDCRNYLRRANVRIANFAAPHHTKKILFAFTPRVQPPAPIESLMFTGVHKKNPCSHVLFDRGWNGEERKEERSMRVSKCPRFMQVSCWTKSAYSALSFVLNPSRISVSFFQIDQKYLISLQTPLPSHHSFSPSKPPPTNNPAPVRTPPPSIRLLDARVGLLNQVFAAVGFIVVVDFGVDFRYVADVGIEHGRVAERSAYASPVVRREVKALSRTF